jgi:hypothetical protein
LKVERKAQVAGNGRRCAVLAKQRRVLKEGGGPDVQARPVSGRKERERGGEGGVGPRGTDGPEGGIGPVKRKVGRRGDLGRSGRKVGGFGVSFSYFFQTFSNFIFFSNTFQT